MDIDVFEDIVTIRQELLRFDEYSSLGIDIIHEENRNMTQYATWIEVNGYIDLLEWGWN